MHNFDRTDSTGKPETLQGPHGQAAREDKRSLSPSTVETDTHQITFLTTVDEEMTEEVFGAARRDKSELE